MANGLRAKSALPGPANGRGLWGPIREGFAGAWQRGIELEPTPNLAAYAPIYACATRIANDIAKLRPEMLVQDNEEPDVWDPAPATSPYWQPLRKPNHFETWGQFINRWLLSKLLFGNTYVLKLRDMRGVVYALYVLDPRGVTPLVTPGGDVYYGLSGNALARIPAGIQAAPAREVIHDRGPCFWHPLVGIPPVYACALSGTLGLRIQQNSTVFFGNLSRPSGILTAPHTIDDVTATRLKEAWQENYGGANLGKIAVAGDGLEYTPITVPAEQSQLVEQLGLTAIDVATAFAMPAYKINQGPMPTNNNVQALDQQYYSNCLQAYIEDIEACLDQGFEVPSGYGTVLNLDGLMRMDTATQMDVLVKGVGGAILKPDEARAKLGRKKVKGGDAVYLQQQNYSVEALAKRDANADPFSVGKPVATPPAPAPIPTPGPAPTPEPSKSLEILLTKAIDDARLAAERAVQAEAQLAAEQAARVASEGRMKTAELAAQEAASIADQAATRARVAEVPPVAVDQSDDGEFALAMIKAFETAEPICG